MNPFKIISAQIDSTADFICRGKWGKIVYPPPFGRDAFPEEAYIADIDAKTGASLKLTILNARGRIWTMVAGGGASGRRPCNRTNIGLKKRLKIPLSF